MRCSHTVLRLVLGGAIAACSLGSLSPAVAAVYAASQALPPAVIQQFLSNPDALLTQYPNGGAQLIAQVRDLAASDPATLKPLLALLKTANADQASAIGTGLGQVAIMAVKHDPAYASEIQEEVIASQNNSTLVAFNAAIGGSIQLTAAGPGGGGGGGGGGEEGTGTNGSFGGFFAGNPENFITSVVNTPDNFPLDFSPGGSVFTGTTTTITQNTSPVNP
ncbi:MAG: hypothetical protein WBM24_25730 [Candidatus Sulfotelmatobacter sp.]